MRRQVARGAFDAATERTANIEQVPGVRASVHVAVREFVRRATACLPRRSAERVLSARFRRRGVAEEEIFVRVLACGLEIASFKRNDRAPL